MNGSLVVEDVSWVIIGRDWKWRITLPNDQKRFYFPIEEVQYVVILYMTASISYRAIYFDIAQ